MKHINLGITLNIEIPDFLLEMSKQMSEQPNRSTAHPFWQVRCKRYIITEAGYNEHHWELINEEFDVIYRSDSNEDSNTILLERYPEFCSRWVKLNGDYFLDEFDIDYDGLPEGVTKIYLQEIEEIVSTHLTEHDANWFIKRKQHDYPKLYTYVESAYWSPQLKQLQDWIISLTE